MKRTNKEILCACGCGQKLLEYSIHGDKRKYVNGHNNNGTKRSAETKRKMSEANKGHEVSDKTKRKISEANKGKIASKETKLKLSKASKGRIHSIETKKKLSEVNKGMKNPNFGKLISNDTKSKMSKAHKGHEVSNATKKKISKTKKGVKASIKTKRKMSEAKKGLLMGKRNGMWKGGVSFEPYCPKFNNTFKEKIRDKFNRKCFLCGIPENGRRLSVHHVKYNKNCGCDNDLKCDYVPLCASCHGKTNHNRSKWEKLISHKLYLLSL